LLAHLNFETRQQKPCASKIILLARAHQKKDTYTRDTQPNYQKVIRYFQQKFQE
jgi:hypothetical protein